MKPLRESDAARIARRVRGDWETTDVERALAATHARLAVRRQRFVLGTAALVLAVAALAVFVLRRSVADVPVVAHGAAPAANPGDPVTYFADGSTARVLHHGQGGQVVVRTATEARIETELESGAAEFTVAPRPSRAFIVRAGTVTVEVIGTQFVVEHATEGSRVRVAVTRGKVKVTAGSEQALLVPGESRWFGPEEKPAAPDGVEAIADDKDTALPDAAAHTAPTPRDRFVDLARRGEYGSAYQVLARSPNAVGSGAEELMLAADAARLSNHPAEALVYLRRVTREHPHDSRAPLSAFTQGRILLSQLGRPAEAAEAFEQARRLAPNGPLAGRALARQIEALNRAGDVEKARALAAEHPSEPRKR